MKKNLLHLAKKCLKYSSLVFLIAILIRYTLRINLTITKINIQQQASNIEKFRLVAQNKSSLLPSFDLDASFSLVDTFEGSNSNWRRDVSPSPNKRDLFYSNSFVNVHNFSAFLNSKYFYFDREFNETTDIPKPMCPYVPANLVGKIPIDSREIEYEEVVRRYKNELGSNSGGHWKPKNCLAHSRVAIIIPYRDRQKHLNVFLNHMHGFLQKQQIDYAIYIIEEAPNVKFNRALLMNIGFNESIKDYDWSCFIFHDVDLVPEDDRNLYYCPYYPRHMSTNVNTFDYVLPYKEIMGGVTAMSRSHFELINGFSNIYFGWGGEDDDLSERVRENNLKIIRYPEYISRYYMLFHEKDAPSKQRFNLLESAKKRFKTDGLNSLKYTVLKKEFRELYTWILVSFEEPNEL